MGVRPQQNAFLDRGLTATNYGCLQGDGINRDPLGEAGGINLYGFVGNDPVNYIDPLGQSGIFSSDISQDEWDRISQEHGGPLQNPRNPSLDDWLDKALECGIKGAFVTKAQSAQGAESVKQVGIIAAAGAALPELRMGQMALAGARAATKGASKVFSAEKQALVDMAKADKRLGITKADMQAYKDLNKGLPDPFPANKVRGPEVHPNRGPQAQLPHGHVGPVDYIPIK